LLLIYYQTFCAGNVAMDRCQYVVFSRYRYSLFIDDNFHYT